MKLFRDLVGALGVVVFALALLSPAESYGITWFTGRPRCIDGAGAGAVTCGSPACRTAEGDCTTTVTVQPGQVVCLGVNCETARPACTCRDTWSGCFCDNR
jgi:hypothetical protein